MMLRLRCHEAGWRGKWEQVIFASGAQRSSYSCGAFAVATAASLLCRRSPGGAPSTAVALEEAACNGDRLALKDALVEAALEGGFVPGLTRSEVQRNVGFRPTELEPVRRNLAHRLKMAGVPEECWRPLLAPVAKPWFTGKN